MQQSPTSRSSNLQQPRHRAWLVVVLGALLVQSLFPSGYMPANLKDGWVAMLCPDGLPAAFVQQLASRQTGAHAHHHGHAGQEGGHNSKLSMGDCQLGSALDQPVDVAAVTPAVMEDALPPRQPTPEQVWVTAGHLRYTRTRAPPLS